VGRKLFLPALLFAIAVSGFTSLYALDFSLRPRGFVFIPAGAGNEAADGNERYSIGGGGDLGFELDLASIWPNTLGIGYTTGIEGGLLYNSYKSPASGTSQIYSAGWGLGLYYFPLSRLFTRLDGGLGVYQIILDEGKGSPGLWWRAGGEIGFRFTPAFTLAANAGWRQYHSSNGSGGLANSGLYTGLTLQITFETGAKSNNDGADAVFVQDDGMYPVFLSLYQKTPLGTLTIRNNENAEIRDVRVSFRAGDYTASEYPCGIMPLVAKGRSAEIPLYADFSPDVLRFTDTGRILGEVIVRYRFLGKEKQTVQTVSIQVYNRNSFPQISGSADLSGLAAFVSPTSPDILEYAKNVTGLARSGRRTGLNQNMQFAVWLFEGLRAAGIKRNDTHTAANEVQYPADTLAFRTGNNVDIGLLYAAALEASGIPCALIPLEDDFIISYYLGVSEAGAGLLFNGLDRVLVIDDQVWMPLSMNGFNEGFMAAWEKGVETLNEVFAGGKEADFIILENAWGVYPPAPLPAQGAAPAAAGGTLTEAAGRIIGQYIEQEIQPQVQAVQRQIAAAPTAALYNRLGILLIRSGRTTDAKAAYERAAGMGSVPAMTNRGNLALIEKDYAAAGRWFRGALERQPENRSALRGLEQIEERQE
jgi:tetratricopeptide (TPR) repeat protein